MTPGPAVFNTGDAEKIEAAQAPPVLGRGEGVPELVTVLENALRVNQLKYMTLEAYYRGQHPHSFDSLRFQQAFGVQLRQFADNWLRLVVQSTSNRLRIEGFRVGDGTDDTGADGLGWSIWKANKLAQGSRMVHRSAQKYGTGFLLVDPTDADGGTPPRITVESAMQVVGQRDAANRYTLLNAIKKWVGNDGFLYLNLYLPDVVQKFRSSQSPASVMPGDRSQFAANVNWVQVGEVPNSLGTVPVVPVENEPDEVTGGQSVLDDLVPLNDALNKLLRDMLVASEYQSFRQRAVMGVDVPRDPATGKPMTERMAELTASERRVWFFPSSDTKLFEFSQVDLQPFIAAIEMMVHHIAMVSCTPAYMLVGKMANLPLAVDTVVPTPAGRTTMGDLKVGDQVYAPDGRPVDVVDVLPIRYGRDCYRMRFDDGTEVVADGDHKWETTHFVDPEQPYARRGGAQRETSVVTTKQIAASLKTGMGTHNHFIPVAAPYHGATLSYPIDPYALGCWLGDGNRAGSQMTAHVTEAHQLAARLRAVGETVSVYAYPASDERHRDTRLVNPTHDLDRCPRGHLRPRGTKTETARCAPCANMHFRRRYYGESVPKPTNTAFKRRLREIGVLGNKHIPEQYFHGSAEQRLALLQGIMDTDGSVDRPNGAASGGVAIKLHDKRLAKDVHRLAQSLGHKVQLRQRTWRSKGGSLPSVRASEGECWRMSWTPPHIVFRMQRKAALQRLPVEGGDGRSSSPFRRHIVGCEPTKSVPVRCINVASDEHQFCITNSLLITHNSADAIRAAELGFQGKLEGMQEDFDPGWHRTMGLGLQAMGSAGAGEPIETIWKDAAANSGSVLSNELSQMGSLGVPRQVLWGRWGASPQDISRWEAMNQTRDPTLVTPPSPPAVPLMGSEPGDGSGDQAEDGQVSDGGVQDG